MTDRGVEAGQAGVDPAVWRQVQGAAGNERSVVLLSHDFSTAAAAAADPSSKNVLEVLALVTSAMLKPDNWNEPFTPSITLRDGRRSALPIDLDDTQRALLCVSPPRSTTPTTLRCARGSATSAGRTSIAATRRCWPPRLMRTRRCLSNRMCGTVTAGKNGSGRSSWPGGAALRAANRSEQCR